jgi:Carboxypeptidase regulatory-like domain
MKLIVAFCILLIGGLQTGTTIKQAQPTASVHGHILNSFGLPVTKSTIEISLEAGAQSFQVRTDDQGNYRVDKLPAGENVIVFFSRGFITERKAVRLEKNSDVRLDVGLMAGYLGDALPLKLSGVVRLTDKSPLPDATVTVVNAFNQRFSSNQNTDGAGRYQIEVVYPGQYVVYVSKPGFEISTTAVIFPATLPREEHTADFVLTPIRLP